MPELFSAPASQRLKDRSRREHFAAVPYFDGVMCGEIDPLIGSFAGEPELHHPIRGRIKDVPAFERLVAETHDWLQERNVVVEDVNTIVTPRRSVEEVLLHLDGADGRVSIPQALVADRDEDARILELRLYYSRWPVTRRHANRPPVLQPDAALRVADVVGDYQRALARGDVEAVVATFEPDGSMREPAGGAYVHHGTDELRALYTRFFSDGGISLEHCAVADDGRACALEYNVVAWGRTELAPQAGVAVYVRGDSGRLASARIYDDSDPPL